MLPMHLLIGIALGLAVARGMPARFGIAFCAAASIAWGVVIAVFVTDRGDWLTGLAGGTALAAANAIVGAIVGGIAGAVAGALTARRRIS